MATTTKTLTPTNQTITIPDMTERPNASLLTDGIGKEADAINALNSKLTSLVKRKVVSGTTDGYGQLQIGLDPRTSAVLSVGCTNLTYRHAWVEEFRSGQQSFYQVRMLDSSNARMTNTAVELEIWYVETWTNVT